MRPSVRYARQERITLMNLKRRSYSSLRALSPCADLIMLTTKAYPLLNVLSHLVQTSSAVERLDAALRPISSLNGLLLEDQQFGFLLFRLSNCTDCLAQCLA